MKAALTKQGALVIVLSDNAHNNSLQLGYPTLFKKVISREIVYQKVRDCISATAEAPAQLPQRAGAVSGVQSSKKPALENVHGQDGLVHNDTSLHVLVAEDNPVNQKVVCKMLDKMNIKYVVANTGREALNQIKETQKKNKHFSMIFMDCQMPEMDGYEASRELNSLFESGIYEKTPIIAMTAHALPGDREKCLNAGMDDYISKPIRMTEIERVIEEWA